MVGEVGFLELNLAINDIFEQAAHAKHQIVEGHFILILCCLFSFFLVKLTHSVEVQPEIATSEVETVEQQGQIEINSKIVESNEFLNR